MIQGPGAAASVDSVCWSAGGRTFRTWKLTQLPGVTNEVLETVPFSLRMLVQSVGATKGAAPETLAALLTGGARDPVPLFPTRVILQDNNGLPVLTDLAALRDEAARRGVDPLNIEPRIPLDLVIDHSSRVDVQGTAGAYQENLKREYERNEERYRFFKWAGQAFHNVRVLPPGQGIIHQVNLERLAEVVVPTVTADGTPWIRPEWVLGTDSHTPMMNGLGVPGWGIGGIPALAVALGEPVWLAPPEVVVVELTGTPQPRVSAMDIALYCTARLREIGVTGKWLEFTGEGMDRLTVPDRATLANMAPEYGATMAYFPPDRLVLRYLRETGRPEATVALVAQYLKDHGLYRHRGETLVRPTANLSIALDKIGVAVAGPQYPHQHRPVGMGSQPLPAQAHRQPVLLAAITSCTSTANPKMVVTAGLLAQNAVRQGLSVPPHVKTSLAPGSVGVAQYLRAGGLLTSLEQLGFQIVGFGCTTCVGNSGPLLPAAETMLNEDVQGVAVLSGNRNFSGRIHPRISHAYLMSPALVVAYALAGRFVDFGGEPVATGPGGAVYLEDLWPSDDDVAAYLGRYYPAAHPLPAPVEARRRWEAVPLAEGARFAWASESTYLVRPPFFDQKSPPAGKARVLGVFGDDVTTDHISPTGPILPEDPAGQYLMHSGVEPPGFNSYGSRRGNHRVMVRGMFANPHVHNGLIEEAGPYTKYLPHGSVGEIHEVAARYMEESVPAVLVAGHHFGMGSSRDWAVRGLSLLGVRVVLARSFEEIFRANLVSLGIWPMLYTEALDWDTVSWIDIRPIERIGKPHDVVTLPCETGSRGLQCIAVEPAVRTMVELTTLRAGGSYTQILTNLFAERGQSNG